MTQGEAAKKYKLPRYDVCNMLTDLKPVGIIQKKTRPLNDYCEADMVRSFLKNFKKRYTNHKKRADRWLLEANRVKKIYDETNKMNK